MQDESKDEETEERKGNKKEAMTEKQSNNPLKHSKKKECKCGSKDHSQILSPRCPWKGL
jgi:hypothetical protein